MPKLKPKPTPKNRTNDLLRVSAELRTARVQMLERQADYELALGHLGIAERLSRHASDLREAVSNRQHAELLYSQAYDARAAVSA